MTAPTAFDALSRAQRRAHSTPTTSSDSGVICSASSRSTSSTTTGPGRTGASRFDRLIPLPLVKGWLARESDAKTSSASSFMSTSASRDS
jgi:hypothetical protein